MGDETLAQRKLLAVLSPREAYSLPFIPQAQSPRHPQFTQRPHPPPGAVAHGALFRTWHLSPSLRDARSLGQVPVHNALAQEALPAGGGRSLHCLVCGDNENTERIRKGVGSGSWGLVKVEPFRGCRAGTQREPVGD